MTDPDNFHAQADDALRRHDIATAGDALRRAVSIDPSDFDAWMKLAVVARLAQDPLSALVAVNEALRLRPLFYLSLLLKGNLLQRAGDADGAAELYAAAIFHSAHQEDVPAPVHRQLGDAEAFLRDHRLGVDRRVAAALDTVANLDDSDRSRATLFTDNILRRRKDYHQQPTHFRFPGLPDIEFFDDHFADVRARLEVATDEIRDEFLAISNACPQAASPYVNFRAGEPVGQWSALNRSSNWNALHLVRYGAIVEEHAARCPATMACLAGDERADVAGLTPNLMFSILAPRTHIPPHTGVANFRTVLHLPLIVPDGCRFRVGNQIRAWQVGTAWIFDDTIEHEAWNDSDEIRVILIADLWRPEFDLRDRAVVRAVMSALSTDAAIGAL